MKQQMSQLLLSKGLSPQIDSKMNHNSILPNPLMMVICGKTGSGKTSLLMKLLLTENFLDYNNLIIFTPTPEQSDYLLLKYGLQYKLSKTDMIAIREILPQYRDEQIPEICRIYSEGMSRINSEPIKLTIYEKMQDIPLPNTLDKYQKNLIVFDDCVDFKDQSIIETYFIKGRHNNCSCIYLAQNYYGIPKRNIRTQLSAIVLFKLGESDKKFSHEHVSSFIDKKDYNHKINTIWKKPHAYVYIDKINEYLTDNLFEQT